jgi:DNA-repair protein XRCC2
MRNTNDKTGMPSLEEKFVFKTHASQQDNNSKETEDFIRVCLARLFILRCNSSLELLATMLSLEQMLIAKPEICVVMIDSLSAFYWIDRSTGGESTTDQEENLKRIIEVIKKYAKEHQLVFLATTHAIFNSSKRNQESAGIENYLCKSWLSVVRYRYLFRYHMEYDSRSSRSQSVYIAQRTFPKSNSIKKFYIHEKGIEFRS